MSWSECKIEISPIDESTGLPSTTGWKSIGTIKDKSSSLSSDTGEELEAYATGHKRVGYEQQEGDFTLATTVIEPEDDLYVALDLAEKEDSSGDLLVKTHVPGSYYGVRVTPKNKGGRGIEAPYCFISTSPDWSEETGDEMPLTIAILHNEDLGYWYKKFRAKTANFAPVAGAAGA